MPASVRRARWQEAPCPSDLAPRLCRELGVSPLLGRLLANRGLATPEQARLFLQGSLDDLPDPRLLAGMEAAVSLLDAALAGGEHIRVWGDYDVDGVAATALLVRALQALGGNVSHYLPHRVQEGYGLNQAALHRCAREGVKLLVTVDCGIGAGDEVALARRLGMQVVITDHHLPPEALPPADAIINPHQPGCAYPEKELCGAGLAFKLLDALCRRRGLAARSPCHFLDLVALATVADMVPLQGENRLLVQAGLSALRTTRKLGLQALMAEAQIEPERLDVYHLGYVLGPRLNAAGRLQSAQAALDLLLTPDAAEAAALARQLSQWNRARQEEEKRTLEQALAMVQAECDLEREWALVLAHESWHPGVVGIVASRLVERYCRPALLVALRDGAGKGSGRSIPGFHLYQALCECADLLERFGGHEMAAGFSVAPEQVPALRQRLCQVAAAQLRPEQLSPLLVVDAWVKPAALGVELGQECARLQPFGHGNPSPLLGLQGAELCEARPVGDGSHLRLRLRAGGQEHTGIWFGYGYLAEHLQPPEPLDLVFVPALNEWNGACRLDLQVADLRAGRELPLAPG